jgi:hypothetical protein
MRYFLGFVLILCLSGCYEKGQPITVDQQTAGSDYKVVRLFAHEGCTVYRFWDASPVYYTDCRGQTQSSVRSGKGSSRRVFNSTADE